MPNLHRCGGATFNGFKVENKDGYYLTDVQKPLKARKNYTGRFIPNRSKTVYSSNGYEDIIITVTVAIRFSSLIDRARKIAQLMDHWCEVEGHLQFKDSNLYYVGIALDEVMPAEENFCTELTFSFLCKPFLFGETFTSQLVIGANTVLYKGNYEQYPKLLVSGNGSCTVSCNGDTFTLVVSNNETVTVDGENAIVYAGTPEIANNRMANFTGDFIKLDKGLENKVTVSGACSVRLIYTDKYKYEVVSM